MNKIAKHPEPPYRGAGGEGAIDADFAAVSDRSNQNPSGL
jgi:hypothetical protein